MQPWPWSTWIRPHLPHPTPPLIGSEHPKSLPHAALAMAYLDAALSRLRAAADAEWAVLQWVMAESTGELSKWAKCVWECEQPGLADRWVVSEVVGLLVGWSLGGSACGISHVCADWNSRSPATAGW